MYNISIVEINLKLLLKYNTIELRYKKDVQYSLFNIKLSVRGKKGEVAHQSALDDGASRNGISVGGCGTARLVAGIAAAHTTAYQAVAGADASCS
jgi:hypothetical protein